MSKSINNIIDNTGQNESDHLEIYPTYKLQQTFFKGLRDLMILSEPEQSHLKTRCGRLGIGLANRDLAWHAYDSFQLLTPEINKNKSG